MAVLIPVTGVGLDDYRVPEGYTELIWVVTPVLPEAGKQCAFCGELGSTDTHPKYGWDRCHRPACNMAEAAHHERLIAGLVDCPETREDALRYAKRVLSA